MHNVIPWLARWVITNKRIATHEFDVVGNQHQGPAWKRSPHASSGVRHDQDLHPKLCKDPRRQAGHRGGLPLIQMKASRLHDDGDALERCDNHLALLPRDSALGGTRDGLVW